MKVESKQSRRDFLKYCTLYSIAFAFPNFNLFGRKIPTYVEDLKLIDPKLGVNIVNNISNLKPYKKYGRGRNARKYSNLKELFPRGLYDLSRLSQDDLIMSNENFYTRTEVPNKLNVDKLTHIEVSGLVEKPSSIEIKKIIESSQDIGVTMMECAGNDKFVKFRLMSAARWSGVPVDKLFDLSGIKSKATHVYISGFDKSTNTGWNGPFGVKSYAGASWIFSLEELKKQKAFFATGMNGKPLELDRGFPCRLMVPGYYGCASIKWVNEIVFFNADNKTLATGQMREFADRTHQNGSPKLYKDHKPPELDLTALPIKVEKWEKSNGKSIYRIIGISWGGIEVLNPALRISITKKRGAREVVSEQPVEMDNRENLLSWQHWSYWWEPKGRGTYYFDMTTANEDINTRRLNKGYYRQAVRI